MPFKIFLSHACNNDIVLIILFLETEILVSTLPEIELPLL